jgi:hypothetical protein
MMSDLERAVDPADGGESEGGLQFELEGDEIEPAEGAPDPLHPVDRGRR